MVAHHHEPGLHRFSAGDQAMSALPAGVRISLTLDTDWAAEEVLDDVLGLLDEAGIQVTFFATHRSAAMDRAGTLGHEIGLHPNFENDNPLDALLALKAIYPEAIGVRSHRLRQDSAILNAFQQAGMAYDSNIFAFLEPDFTGYRYYTGMRRFPIYWGDLTAVNLRKGLELDSMPMRPDRDYTFLFHPIHIFLNTVSAAHYDRARPHARDLAVLRDLRRPPGSAGVRDMFLAMLDSVRGRTILLRDQIATETCHLP